MNKMIIFISAGIFIAFIHSGRSLGQQTTLLKGQMVQWQADMMDSRQKIQNKASLGSQPPVSLSTEYGLVLNSLRGLESYSGTSMNVQLEGASDTGDIASHYQETAYKGIRGLKIQIVVDKFSKETDMGAVLDDIHLLEQTADFLASAINKDNNNLIVKGEIYGL